MGTASVEECNCLLDTLRQQLQLHCDIKTVRAFVQAQDASLVQGDYLELQTHWRAVIAGFAHVLDDVFLASAYRIVCIDATFIGNGDVEGNGASILYIARQNANQFVPLLRVDAVEADGPRESFRSNACDKEIAADAPGDENHGFSSDSSSDEEAGHAASGENATSFNDTGAADVEDA